MQIGIHGRVITEESKQYLLAVLEIINSRNHSIVLTAEFVELNKNSTLDFSSYQIIDTKLKLDSIDYFVSLGGDGTLLETVSIVGSAEIPILGVNLGTLGFLATTSKSDIATAFELFFNKKFTIDNRLLIHADSQDKIFGTHAFALNEVAIVKRDTSSMVVVHCYINDQFINTYWADGLMVSTPTGSTGYSLSCGGPLVLPESNSFIITPVSPHNLNVRPLIVSASSVISFKIEGKGRTFLTSLDSRSFVIENKVKISLRKENFYAKLIKLEGYNFFDTLRNKLNWGLDIRN